MSPEEALKVVEASRSLADEARLSLVQLRASHENTIVLVEKARRRIDASFQALSRLKTMDAIDLTIRSSARSELRAVRD